MRCSRKGRRRSSGTWLKTDEMFRTLMGEKVEPHRDLIQKHALEVKREEIDYHGA